VKATQKLHALGQSLWLDNITRELLTSGTLGRYIDELSVTGLTSNPTIFDHAVAHSHAYDADIRRLVAAGKSDEVLFFELAVADLTEAADLFAPIYQRTAGVDGFVSLEVSPLLAHDTARTAAEARALHGKAKRANLFIKIPGTIEGLPAIEEAIYSGVPVNVTLLFSRDDYMRAADAYMRGLERRVAAGLSPDVRSVASLFVSRWDRATMDKLPDELRDRLGIAISQQAYKAYRDLLEADRWQRLAGQGARPQRLLFASTATRIRRPRTCSTWARWRRRTRSTRCRRRRCLPSPLTAWWISRCAGTATTASRCWRALPVPASMSRHLPGSCRTTAPRGSSIPGRTCLARSKQRARRWPRLSRRD
jgi:transaldolase